MAPLHQFILFGDSITEGCNNKSLGFSLASELQCDWKRRLDVINRGYSGYNTNHAVEVLENVMPTASQAAVDFLTIWFGSNDCNKSPMFKQYVPLSEFKENLKTIINHQLTKAQSPKIVLITNTPCEENMLLEFVKGMEDPIIPRAKDAAAYAAATREVGEELGIPVVDAWKAFAIRAGWKEVDEVVPGMEDRTGKNEKLAELLVDGLHLSAAGYRIVYEELTKTILETWPEENPAKKPFAQKIAWEVELGNNFWDIN